jgi:hypothetical protein
MTDTTKNAIKEAFPKGRVRVYACGGASINIMADLGALEINPDLMADFHVVQLDTSKSNMHARASNYEQYLLPKMANTDSVDGGGKDRAENKALIEQHADPILKMYPPLEANIVISTGSGSSGSVLAPELVNKLLARGEAVVVLLIGTTGSRIEALNSIGTMTNYEQIAKARQMPVIMSYLQNSPDMPREKVNVHMLSTISYLGMLFSRRNNGMDTKDTSNWLNFTKPGLTKGLLPQLYSLTILLRSFTENGEEEFADNLDKLGNILSVATLTRAGTPPELPSEYMPEYHTEGFVPDLRDSKVFDGQSANFIISDGLVNSFMASLKSFSKRQRPNVVQFAASQDEDDEPTVSFS